MKRLIKLSVCLLTLLATMTGCDDDSGTGVTTEPTLRETAGEQAGGAMINGGAEVISPLCDELYDQFGPAPVGVRELTVEGAALTVWYPAVDGSEAGASQYIYDMREALPEDVASQIPEEAAPTFEMPAYLDLPVAEGQFPVVMFAHGFAGYRRQSSAMMAHLASWGFIVTSAENAGINLANTLSGGTPGADQGPALMEATLALLTAENGESSSDFNGRLDLANIGVMGHSMGTSTAINVAALDEISTWVALAGAGFGAGPEKPFMIIGGTTDELAVPVRVEAAYNEQPSATKRMIVIDEAGHLAFSDICLIAQEEGGLVSVATMYGLEVPQLIVDLSQDGCRETDLPPSEAWPVIHHFVTAHFFETLRGETVGLKFSEEVRSCFSDQINKYLETVGGDTGPVTGGAEMAGAETSGTEMAGAEMAGTEAAGAEMGGAEMAGTETSGPTREPGVPGEVTCGDTVCDITANICCLGITGDATCGPDDCALGTAPQACDGPEDCPDAQQCCVSFPAGASCQDVCDGFGSEPLCHLDSECPADEVCLDCDYPGGSRVSLCGELGSTPPGAMGCDDRGPREEDAPDAEMAGTEIAGTEMAGTEMAGTEMAGTEMAGTEMAGTEMAGTEMAGTEMAGTEMSTEPLGEPAEGVVACGETSCDLSTDTCCLGLFGASCDPGVNQSCTFSSNVICDGAEDCPEADQQCCATVTGSFECSNACSGATLCHSDDECAQGEICKLCAFPGAELAVCGAPSEVVPGSFSCDR